jgi:hypothetical protein
MDEIIKKIIKPMADCPKNGEPFHAVTRGGSIIRAYERNGDIFPCGVSAIVGHMSKSDFLGWYPEGHLGRIVSADMHTSTVEVDVYGRGTKGAVIGQEVLLFVLSDDQQERES